VPVSLNSNLHNVQAHGICSLSVEEHQDGSKFVYMHAERGSENGMRGRSEEYLLENVSHFTTLQDSFASVLVRL